MRAAMLEDKFITMLCTLWYNCGMTRLNSAAAKAISRTIARKIAIPLPKLRALDLFARKTLVPSGINILFSKNLTEGVKIYANTKPHIMGLSMFKSIEIDSLRPAHR